MFFDTHDMQRFKEAAAPFVKAASKTLVAQVLSNTVAPSDLWFLACVHRKAPYIFERFAEMKKDEPQYKSELAIAGLSVRPGWQFTHRMEKQWVFETTISFRRASLVDDPDLREEEEGLISVKMDGEKKMVRVGEEYDVSDVFYLMNKNDEGKYPRRYVATEVPTLSPTFVATDMSELAENVIGFLSNVDDRTRNFFTRARILYSSRVKKETS